jgi:acyl dehydratase
MEGVSVVSADVATNPRGIFDRSVKGVTVDPMPVLIERDRIRFFAKVLGETDPIHFDVNAARAAGHPDLVAPPTFFMVVEAAAEEERRRRGLQALMQIVRCDFRYLLHGDERYFYDKPIYAGEEVQFSTTVVDFVDKKGGAMELFLSEAKIVHPERGVLVRSRRTLLHRLPEPKSK